MVFAIPARRLALIVLGCLLAGGGAWSAADWYLAYPVDARPTFVGGSSCTECHKDQEHSWHGSDHDRAMEVASDETVLGDFNDSEFTRFGVTTRFFRRDGKFMVNTEGPDGEMQDFEIKYTFGVRPLQQYMVEFPDGRVQVLRVSWDTVQERVVLCHAPRRARRTDRARRSAALDRHRPELEHHVRRVPFDQPAEELRPGVQYVPHDLLGNRRQLRDVPRPGEPACGAGRERIRCSGTGVTATG